MEEELPESLIEIFKRPISVTGIYLKIIRYTYFISSYLISIQFNELCIELIKNLKLLIDLIQSKTVTKKIKEYNDLVQLHADEDQEVDLWELIMENEQNSMAQKIFDEKALFKNGIQFYLSLFTFDTDSQSDYTGAKIEKKKQKTAGKGWFYMKQPEMTDELMMDLKTIKMRNLIYKKRFYKGMLRMLDFAFINFL